MPGGILFRPSKRKQCACRGQKAPRWSLDRSLHTLARLARGSIVGLAPASSWLFAKAEAHDGANGHDPAATTHRLVALDCAILDANPGRAFKRRRGGFCPAPPPTPSDLCLVLQGHIRSRTPDQHVPTVACHHFPRRIKELQERALGLLLTFIAFRAWYAFDFQRHAHAKSLRHAILGTKASKTT